MRLYCLASVSIAIIAKETQPSSEGHLIDLPVQNPELCLTSLIVALRKPQSSSIGKMCVFKRVTYIAPGRFAPWLMWSRPRVACHGYEI